MLDDFEYEQAYRRMLNDEFIALNEITDLTCKQMSSDLVSVIKKDFFDYDNIFFHGITNGYNSTVQHVDERKYLIAKKVNEAFKKWLNDKVALSDNKINNKNNKTNKDNIKEMNDIAAKIAVSDAIKKILELQRVR